MDCSWAVGLGRDNEGVPPLTRQIRQVMEAVLAATQLPDSFSWSTHAEGVIVGYLEKARRSMRALLILGGSDLDDAGDGLARSMFEDAATVGWLARDHTRLDEILAAYDWNWGELRNSWESGHPGEEFPCSADPPLVPGNDPPAKARLTGISARARAAGLLPYMTAYKMLSLSDHSTLAGASFGLDHSPQRRLRLPRFLLAGAMLVNIGRQVDETFSVGWGSALDSLEQRLIRITR